MNVEQINISALPSQVDRTVISDFVAKTFVYVEPSATPAPKDAKAGKPGGV